MTSIKVAQTSGGQISQVRLTQAQTAACRITVHPDTLGLKASYINATAGTRINVGLLLVAL